MPHAHPLDLALADLDAMDDSSFHAEAPHGRLARTLLIAVFSLGLLGLSVGPQAVLTPAAPPVTTLTLTSTSTSQTFDIRPPRVRVVPQAASRTRAVARAPKPRAKAVTSKPRTVKRSFSSATWVRPSRAGVVSNYGPRWGRQHKGVDFGDGYGAPIRSIGDGVVLGAGYLASESGYGKMTLIRHKGGIVSAYAHQSRTAVSVGERVRAGEVIGYVGSTGHSTGPHLHFEIRTSVHGGQINPLRWLRAHGVRI